jgi:Zn ribbon nucleic-acid-binding protein
MADLESIPCPNCTPEDAYDRNHNLTGYWRTDRVENVKRCANCGHEEPYHPQTPRDGREHGMTDSQERELRSIKRFAEADHRGPYDLEMEHTGHGSLRVNLEIYPDDFRLREEYVILISRRGKVTLRSLYGVLTSDATASLFCTSVDAHNETRHA